MRCALLLLVACSSSTTSSPSNKGSSAAPPAPAAGLLPSIETACATDADCDHSYTYELDGKCCNGTCSPKVANHAYVAKVEDVCKRAGWAEENCPVKKCVEPPALACVSGQCREK